MCIGIWLFLNEQYVPRNVTNVEKCRKYFRQNSGSCHKYLLHRYIRKHKLTYNVISFNAAKEANKDFRDFDNNRPWWYQRKLAFLFSLVLFGCYSLYVLLFYGFFTHTQTKHIDWPESPMNCTKKSFFDTITFSFNYNCSFSPLELFVWMYIRKAISIKIYR